MFIHTPSSTVLIKLSNAFTLIKYDVRPTEEPYRFVFPFSIHISFIWTYPPANTCHCSALSDGQSRTHKLFLNLNTFRTLTVHVSMVANRFTKLTLLSSLRNIFSLVYEHSRSNQKLLIQEQQNQQRYTFLTQSESIGNLIQQPVLYLVAGDTTGAGGRPCRTQNTSVLTKMVETGFRTRTVHRVLFASSVFCHSGGINSGSGENNNNSKVSAKKSAVCLRSKSGEAFEQF